ncbi:MAG: ABC transporter permease [Puniceicoccales bacterium]|jgi:phospholipid/cholesterol/gamma-HCH transport system permease protein|nr:ABC transporter permease [Puniceicoccales bacterium]
MKLPTFLLEGDGSSGLRIVLSGNWKSGDFPSVRDCVEKLAAATAESSIEVLAMPDAWDSRFVAFLFVLQKLIEEKKLKIKITQLPDGVARLLNLASAVKAEARGVVNPKATRFSVADALATRLRFLGDTVKGIFRLFCRRVTPHGSGFCRLLRQAGLESLPIVSTVSFLIGVILGFIGSVQLARFGASLFVANLVGIAVVREMAPLMTAVVLAGRVGAAFSATIATMRTRGEIDALTTFGIPAVDFLVVPRVMAMALMTPLLCIFSSFVAIGGGMAVALPMLNIGSSRYVHETAASIGVCVFCFGVVKSIVFALLIASIACRSGMTCDRTAEGVGRATTNAVVNAITAIIVADAVCDAIATRLLI